MKRSLMRSSILLGAATAAVLAVTACGDSTTGPAGQEDSQLTLSYTDGSGYHASGAPTLDGSGDVTSAPFAVAVRDSLGGVVITGFQPTQGRLGDLFVLQLSPVRVGTFGSCGSDASCHGRILEDFDAEARQAGGTSWEIVAGTVNVDEVGSDRIKGSFSNLVLQAQDTVESDRTVPSGTFDLQLLSEAEGKQATTTLLCQAAQPLAGLNCPQAAGHELSFTWEDGVPYEAYGDPAFAGGALTLSTFATAFPDSLGGLVITSFEVTAPQNSGVAYGDLFVLQLASAHTGSFGPCGTTDACHGQLLEGFLTSDLQTHGPVWSVVGGTVQVDSLGPDHLQGNFSDLVLQRQDSVAANRTIPSGTFDLKPVSNGDDVAAMRCFLESIGGPGC